MAPSLVSSGSEKMTCAPKERTIFFLASLTFSGITSATGIFMAAPIQAYAMPVLPLVESINVRPRRDGRASRMTCNPARSLTDPPGLNHSSLAWISTSGRGSSVRSLTSGVSPIASISEFTEQFHRRAGALVRAALRRYRLVGGRAGDDLDAAGREVDRRPARGLRLAADADFQAQRALLVEAFEQQVARVALLFFGRQH